MEILNELLNIDVYLDARRLPSDCQPAYAVRDEDATLVFIDPRASRADIAAWSLDNLTDAEANVVRRAYEQPDRGGGILDDDLLDDDGLWIPEALRLPSPAQMAQALRDEAREARERSVRLREIVRLERVLRQPTPSMSSNARNGRP